MTQYYLKTRIFSP